MEEQKCYIAIASESSPLGVGRPHALGSWGRKDMAVEALMEYVRDDLMSYPEPCYQRSYTEMFDEVYQGVKERGEVKLLADKDDPRSAFRLYKIVQTTHIPDNSEERNGRYRLVATKLDGSEEIICDSDFRLALFASGKDILTYSGDAYAKIDVIDLETRDIMDTAAVLER